MAQLPPKVPSMTTTNWPDFSHHKMDGGGIHHHHGSSWVDEFLDFSSSRRGSHRRSMSDGVAFLEAPMAEECRRSGSHNAGHDFERFDDDQLMSMFNDDVVVGGPTMSCSNPSSPSSINDDDKHGGPSSDQMMMQQQQQQQVQPKNEPEEDEEEDDSSCKSEGFNSLHATTSEDPNGDKIVDPKRIKRILANRQSAQRSRVRKLQYISELERSVTSLQAEVSVLSPRVAFLDHQRLVLNVDNSVLKQRIAALAQDKLFKDAHQEALKREIERLRQIYYQQNSKKMENNGTVPKSPSRVAETSAEKEQLACN